MLLHTGSLKVFVDDRGPIDVAPEQVILMKPADKEDFRFDSEQESWHRWIHLVNGHWSANLLESLHALPAIIPISNAMNRLTDLILSISDRTVHNSKASPFLTMLCKSAFQLYAEEAASLKNAETIHPLVKMVKQFISQYYEDEITLQQIADYAGVSKVHVIRTFERETGHTPIRYLWRFRTERGLELLHNTGLSIEEVAYRCGYKSVYHFSRNVKQYTGNPPNRIRKQAWNY